MACVSGDPSDSHLGRLGSSALFPVYRKETRDPTIVGGAEVHLFEAM